ncbi:hypothetical protein GXW83_29210 [Streptacidiphilus sp. PB12-B1b]|uniref:hypothetical protein n=1 Tax=Streptacidiphilus sp. PB12-B1b TaxID=2705012 RepID=UPI0015FC8983|nr:hypothetical protein [Streptacidiphilus sp. PB12-B1b]QMU79180.1 hypothetical protein GXW83_29210 [Streptacidiphilus sp. PB12-B1b]
MKINWAALGSTFGVSVVISLAVVAAFCFGVSALARREEALADGAAGRGTAALGGAVLCFALCAAAVGYGLYVIAG